MWARGVLCLALFQTGLYCTLQAGLDLRILQPPLPEYWEDYWIPPASLPLPHLLLPLIPLLALGDLGFAL